MDNKKYIDPELLFRIILLAIGMGCFMGCSQSEISCVSGRCSNGVLDCGEVGVDCGGACAACQDPCAGHCGNAKQDCGEVGVDCGGECADCQSPCAGHCSNGKQDCDETGIDCGGLCGACAVSAGYYFPARSIWYQDVYDVTLSGNAKTTSDAIIADLQSRGGWGNGNVFQIDYSPVVLHADANAPMRDFTTTDDFFDVDCDHVPVPIPPGGFIEGEDGYACTGDGDCHLIVVHEPTKKLYEMWRANITGAGTAGFQGGCLAVWDMTKVYGPSGRGDQCTSADAAGYPIAALLFNADEVAAKRIDHAIRFILPNNRIRNGAYIHPATHSTSACSGGNNAIPYGAHLRLRRDYPLSELPNEGAQTVATALMHYGMFLADGGNIALTAQDDRLSTAKWDGLLAPRDLSKINVTDFEVVNAGEIPIPYTGDCVRNP